MDQEPREQLVELFDKLFPNYGKEMKLNPTQKAEITADLNKGLSIKETAAKHGVSYGQVYNLNLKLQVEKNSQPQQTPAEWSESQVNLVVDVQADKNVVHAYISNQVEPLPLESRLAALRDFVTSTIETYIAELRVSKAQAIPLPPLKGIWKEYGYATKADFITAILTENLDTK